MLQLSGSKWVAGGVVLDAVRTMVVPEKNNIVFTYNAETDRVGGYISVDVDATIATLTATLTSTLLLMYAMASNIKHTILMYLLSSHPTLTLHPLHGTLLYHILSPPTNFHYSPTSMR